jgi:hypothetical protein
MKGPLKSLIPRRDLFRAAIAGIAAAATSALVPEPATAAGSVDLKEKRRARYQANSPEVQDFYRVNSYPAR